jgi:hypothetical protein
VPDDPRRNEREDEVIAALTPVFDEYREAAIAGYKNSGELPSREFWETMKKRLASAVEPVIALVMSDALNGMLRPVFASLATAKNNRAVARDAKRRAEEFSVNFSDMVLTNIAEKVPKAKDEDEGVLLFVTGMFDEIFADSKKTVIAVGLVTAAITAGEMFAAVYIGGILGTPSVASAILDERPSSMGPATIDYEGVPEAGRDSLITVSSKGLVFKIIPVWTTQEDQLVCPICGPLHGLTRENWGEFEGGPPAHYMCRCFLEWIIRLSPET